MVNDTISSPRSTIRPSTRLSSLCHPMQASRELQQASSSEKQGWGMNGSCLNLAFVQGRKAAAAWTAPRPRISPSWAEAS